MIRAGARHGLPASRHCRYFTGVFGANQGIQVDACKRDSTNATLPILLRNTPALPGAPTVELSDFLDRAIDQQRQLHLTPNLQMPVHAVVVGRLAAQARRRFRRSSSVTSAAAHRQDWDSINLNEPNISATASSTSSGKAQANLQANIAAGRGATFAYTGAPAASATADFPRVFQRRRVRQSAGDTAQYTPAELTNATFLGYLAALNPNPFGFCNAPDRERPDDWLHDGDADQRLRRQHRRSGERGGGRTAGELLRGNSGHAQRREPRPASAALAPTRFRSSSAKRFPGGLRSMTSYTWSDAGVLQRYGFSRPLEWIDQSGQVGNVQHARVQGQLTLRAAAAVSKSLPCGHAGWFKRSSAAGRSTEWRVSRPARRSTSATSRLVGMSR